MANIVTIAPAVGHALLTTQLGVGASPGYDAIDLRRMAQVGSREGVHDATGWKAHEHTPNALSVDVDASVGLATVQGDAVVGQGYYVVAPHASVAALTITTAHVSLPRLDQILLHIYDDGIDGSGLSTARLEVLDGSPTAGANIDNRYGAAALPPSAMLLADIIVGPGVPSITSAAVRDRRDLVADTAQTGDLIFTAASSRIGAVPSDLTALSRTGYKRLFDTIGTTYGAGDGSTTFNVPDMRGRVPVGAGTGPGLTARTRGQQTSGEENHQITTAELAQHTHTGSDGGHFHGLSNPPMNPSGQSWSKLGGVSGTPGSGSNYVVPYNNNYAGDSDTATDLGHAAVSVGNAGSNTPHNNMQPYTVGTWFIKT